MSKLLNSHDRLFGQQILLAAKPVPCCGNRRRASMGHLSNWLADYCQPASIPEQSVVVDDLLWQQSNPALIIDHHFRKRESCGQLNSRKQKASRGRNANASCQPDRNYAAAAAGGSNHPFYSQPNSRKSSSSLNVGGGGEAYGTLRHVPSQPALSRLARALPSAILPAIAALRRGSGGGCSSPFGPRQQQHPSPPPRARGGRRQYSLQSPPQQRQQQHKRFQPVGDETQPQQQQKTKFCNASFGVNSNNTTICRSGGVAAGGAVERRVALRRCPQSDLGTRFQHQHHDGGDGTGMNAQTGTSRTASSSFSGSNESMPTNSGSRNGETATEQESESNIDPVYLALKQATEKYGSRGANNSRRSSQLIAAGESTTPSSTRNLSQASLLDSGTFSCSGEVCSGYGGSTTSSNLMTGGSTPQLQAGHQPSTPTTASRGHTKLTEKMKSFSLDCAEPPSHLQGGSGGGVFPHHRMKPLRSARAFTTGAGSLDHCAERSTSPANNYFARRPPRRLPSVPGQQQQQQTVAVQQQPIQVRLVPTVIFTLAALHVHFVRVNVWWWWDNGDPDWKHGFKLNYCSEKLLTFPSACIAAYKTEEEQPMRVTQTCNLVDQKMRLYRDQVVLCNQTRWPKTDV
ncbi:hypothetical protein GPALN_014485 [Globodera pallida]|nr:hypothetical protein GPALN_014485 [Globodera pallida]